MNNHASCPPPQVPDPRGLTTLLQLFRQLGRNGKSARHLHIAPDAWPAAVETARARRVVPQLYTAIERDPPTGPNPDPESTMQLERHAKAMRLNARFMVAQLARVRRLFEDQSIPALAFKGPVLADMAYGSIGAREFGDIDLVVHSTDFSRAKDVLEASGLFTTKATIEEQRIGQNHLCDSDGRIFVDLHHRLAPTGCPGLADPDAPWRHTMEYRLCGQLIRTFTPSATLVVCCVQAIKDRWNQLCVITDIHALTRRYGNDCIIEGLEIATSWRLRRVYLTSLHIANDLLGVEIPETVRRAMKSEPVVERIGREVHTTLFNGETPGFLDPQHRLNLLLRDGLGERVIYTLRLMPIYARETFTPDSKDREWITLPRWLRFLYPVVRPLRLAVARLQRRHSLSTRAH